MSKICLIGNSGMLGGSVDGQVTKVNLYRKKICDEGHNLLFVDLERFSKKPFSTMLKIRRYVKECDRIVLLTAERGIKFLLPYINFLNKFYKKPFILPMIGINILHRYVDRLNEQQHIDFMINKNYRKKPSKFYKKQLEKVTYILPENKIVADCVADFFNLNNVVVLENFRDLTTLEKKPSKSGNQLKCIFLSRVTKEKGIIELVKAVTELINKGENINLDIYGKITLSNEERLYFNSFLSDKICYKGIIEPKEAINVLSNYDVFVFPTLFKSEGTPGVISEALIAGTPIISSNFIQSKDILVHSYNAFIYNSNNKADLLKILQDFCSGKIDLNAISNNCLESAKRFTYKNNRKKFLKYICGEEEKEY